MDPGSISKAVEKLTTKWGKLTQGNIKKKSASLTQNDNFWVSKSEKNRNEVMWNAGENRIWGAPNLLWVMEQTQL